MRCLLPLLALCTVFAADVAPQTGGADPAPATGPGSKPLRIFLRSGPKSHGPGAHDYPRFKAEWVPLLQARGAQVTAADAFPTREQLAQTDVLVLHAQEAGNIPASEDRANLMEFLRRGGGVVAIHAGMVTRDPEWFKPIMGGTWRQGVTRWLEAPMHLYFTDRDHPITTGASNWSMNDEIYYDLDLLPEARVLATAYTPKAIDTGGRGNREAQARAAEAVALRKGVNIYDIQPQIWSYERQLEGAPRGYRAFVSLPGHRYENFNRPNYRALLLRGIAWAGQRANVDELCRPEELGDTLRYPADGPTHPAKAAAKIEVHPEFNLSLVAAEPLVNKVMNLDWDERGRLWVAETPEYPNGRRVPNVEPWKDSGYLRGARAEREPEDRISILTDTDDPRRVGPAQERLGDAVDAAFAADVLAEDDHAIVVAHLGAHRVGDRLDHRHHLGAGLAGARLGLGRGHGSLVRAGAGCWSGARVTAGSGRLRPRPRPSPSGRAVPVDGGRRAAGAADGLARAASPGRDCPSPRRR